MNKQNKKYIIIYADPPWKYQGEMMNSSATDHYSTMCIEKLKKYNIIYADPPWKFKTWSEKGQKKSGREGKEEKDNPEESNTKSHS